MNQKIIKISKVQEKKVTNTYQYWVSIPKDIVLKLKLEKGASLIWAETEKGFLVHSAFKE